MAHAALSLPLETRCHSFGRAARYASTARVLSVLQSCSARKCGRQSLSTTSNSARPVYSLPSRLLGGGE